MVYLVIIWSIISNNYYIILTIFWSEYSDSIDAFAVLVGSKISYSLNTHQVTSNIGQDLFSKYTSPTGIELKEAMAK